jgi:hypothetical protein
MRELGIIQCDGIVLGAAPLPKTKLEELEQRATTENTAEARRDVRVEAAREEYRARLGNWDISNETLDNLLDPAIFDL